MDISTVETQDNCPVCDGSGVLLGTLGNLNHYRCQACGIGFNVPVEFKWDDAGTDEIARMVGLID